MGQRHHARKLALQALYHLDLSGYAADEGLSYFWSERQDDHVEDSVRNYCEELTKGVYSHREEIDQLIREQSVNWRFERFEVVDRNILRLAVYELLHCPDVPPAVVLNEAIELAKTFGTERSAAFVNGILDAVLSKVKK